MATEQEREKEPGILLGLLLLAPLVAISLFRPDDYNPKEELIDGLYSNFGVFYIGILFLLSYYYSHKTFLLRGFMWICENFSAPRHRKMALFYFGLTLFLTGLSTLNILGVF